MNWKGDSHNKTIVIKHWFCGPFPCVWKGVFVFKVFEMDYIFIIAIFILAALYASVGHGGASGYLALMALFGFEQYTMKSSALTLNLFVAGVSFYSFFRKGYFKFNVLLPFILGSIPMAFLGARMHINSHAYKIILGLFLLIAISRMIISPKGKYKTSKTPPFYLSVGIGTVVGFFSGMIGIGGGIILSPILLLMHWANVKETAGISAMFILLNSMAGLTGLYFNENFHPVPQILLWAFVGLIGGFTGSYISSKKLSQYKVKLLLAGVLLVASIKLFGF